MSGKDQLEVRCPGCGMEAGFRRKRNGDAKGTIMNMSKKPPYVFRFLVSSEVQCRGCLFKAAVAKRSFH